MFLVINLLGISVNVIFLVALIAGVMLCKKQSFTEGFYFFIIMIIVQLHSFVSPLYMNAIFENFQSNRISLGQFIILISYIDKFILAIAFILLVFGLFRRGQLNKSSKLSE